MFAFCGRKTEPNTSEFSGYGLYQYIETGESTCHNHSAHAATGIQVWEDDDKLFVSGTQDTDEAMDAVRKYYQTINEATLNDLTVDMFTVTREWVELERDRECDSITIIRLPDANDVVGYTALMTFHIEG